MRLPVLVLLLMSACVPEAPAPVDPMWDNFGETETEGSASCDNLDGDGHCILPFPSNHWRDEQTGKLALVRDAMPVTTAGNPISVDAFDQDGFGVSSPILFQLQGATLTGVAPAFDAAASLLPGARTVLIDASTGDLIPHWVEYDWLDTSLVDPILVIRTATALPAATRVIVGVRGLVGEDGGVVDPPEGFRALRDQEASRRRGVHARRAHYEDDIFPALAEAGFDRAELQLAWDFTTRGDAGATKDLAEISAGMYAALGAGGPAFVVDNVERVVGDENLALLVDATAQVPSFLTAPDADGVRRLHRDASGALVADGFESVPFRIQVPHSVLVGDDPAPVLQYGHGLLGDMGEANNGWLRQMAQRHRFVILASDMQGMSGASTIVWSRVLLNDAGHMGWLTDEVMQGVANHLALQRLMKTGMDGDVPADLQGEGGAPIWDRSRLWYHGNSQGGTIGVLILATSRDVTRGVLGVPGAAFPFLLNRSSDFVDWASLLQIAYPNPGDITLVLGMLGTAWDHMDGLTWASRIARSPLPDTPAHQALLHVGLEDAQVMNEISWELARAMGASQPVTNARPIWDVPTIDLPVTAPAVVVNWDFGVAPDTTPMDPPVKETDTHADPRALKEAQDQAVHFLETGEVRDTCGGLPCEFSPP